MYMKSNFLSPPLLDTDRINPTKLMKNRNCPPTEFIIPSMEPSFSSATVVNTFGHKFEITGALIDGKLKGPRKLPRYCLHPEKKTANIAVERKYSTPIIKIFLIAVFEKISFMFPFASENFVKKRYTRVKPIVASKKSNINHQPLHSKVKSPVKIPPSNARITTLTVLSSSKASKISQVIISVKNMFHASLSGLKVLPKNAEFTAIIDAAKNPPILPAIFLAIKKTRSTHNAETITG